MKQRTVRPRSGPSFDRAAVEIRSLPITQINPAPYNPRVDLRPGDLEYEKLARSIDEFGLVEPLVWNSRTGHLVGGHQRFKVLLQRGITTAQVSVVDLPIEKEKALNLALNKIAGGWDHEKLAELLNELVELPGFDMALTGFDPPEVDELLASALLRSNAANEEHFDVDAALAESERLGPPVTQPGELILLGREPRLQHRLLCADCTDASVVRELMNGERAALFATDPPYLVGYDGTNHPGSKKGRGMRDEGSRRSTTALGAGGAASIDRRAALPALRDMRSAPGARPRTPRSGNNKDWSSSYGVTWDEFDGNSDLYEKFIAAAVGEAVDERAAWYIWHASRRQALLEAAMKNAGALIHCQIIWAKNRPVLTRTWYSWQHEPCLMGWLEGNKPRRIPGAPVLPTVWRFDTIPNGPERPDHPTPKPVELFEIPMLQHTRAGEVCYEPFAGSGTQFIAAERLGRRCFGVEISQRYCDVIVRRYIAFAGEDSVTPDVLRRYAVKDSGRNAEGAEGRKRQEETSTRSSPRARSGKKNGVQDRGNGVEREMEAKPVNGAPAKSASSAAPAPSRDEGSSKAIRGAVKGASKKARRGSPQASSSRAKKGGPRR